MKSQENNSSKKLHNKEKMKLSKIIFTALAAFALTVTANADENILTVCEKAEISFLNTIAGTNNSADQSFMGSLDEQVQVSYYKMALEKIEQSITEVKKRCNDGASKEILDAYEKKKSEISTQMNAL